MRKFIPFLAATLIAAPAVAGNHAPGAQAPAALSAGEIRKVDKDAGKVTIRHGPLANLDMPPMTMVFRVKERAMLDNVKAGDPIRFRAERVEGTYTVTELQPAK